MDDRLPLAYAQRSRLDLLGEIALKRGMKLVEWLSSLKFFSLKKVFVVANDTTRFKIRIFTDKNTYDIVATSTDYLGCTASTRTPRPGEDHTRGNDLPDGEFSKETFMNILGAIVFYEAKDVVNVVTSSVATEESVDSFQQMLTQNVIEAPGKHEEGKVI